MALGRETHPSLVGRLWQEGAEEAESVFQLN